MQLPAVCYLVNNACSLISASNGRPALLPPLKSPGFGIRSFLSTCIVEKIQSIHHEGVGVEVEQKYDLT